MKDNTIGITGREHGMDLRYIQELLKHKSSEITEIYTYVSERDIRRIKSSLDSILKGDGNATK